MNPNIRTWRDIQNAKRTSTMKEYFLLAILIGCLIIGGIVDKAILMPK